MIGLHRSPFRLPNVFMVGQQSFQLPNNVWTPVPLNGLTEIDTDGMSPANASTTTVASGSNGAALPQGTINVASTTGFPTAGFAMVAISSVYRIFAYTGKTATTFTGCTLGAGSLATGQTVLPCCEQVNSKSVPGVYATVACVTFPAAGNTTGLLGVRLRSTSSPFFAPVGTQHIPNPNSVVTVSVPGQPLLSPAAGGVRAEAFQSSGAAMTIANDFIQAPSLCASLLTAN